jgi:hypothetical protein
MVSVVRSSSEIPAVSCNSSTSRIRSRSSSLHNGSLASALKVAFTCSEVSFARSAKNATCTPHSYAQAQRAQVRSMTISERVLTRFDKLREVLTSTHARIPRCLADARRIEQEVGRAEIAGRDRLTLEADARTLEAQRLTDVRSRSAAIDGVMAMESELMAARRSIEMARETCADSVIRAFQQRYAAAVAVVESLRAEGLAIGQAFELVDATLLGSAAIHRMMTARCVRLVSDQSRAA